MEKIVQKIGDVKIFGDGSLGGKGAGLVKINELSIPHVHKLTTRILTTSYYDRFCERGGKFCKEDVITITNVLEEFGAIPISVRSSATNEACISIGGEVSVHAGENTSFMLPNNHPDAQKRLRQLLQAISQIYFDFIESQGPKSAEKMALVLNPIPGIFHDSMAGPIYYPLVSGVADSYFPYALKEQDPHEGCARVAFGHGYSTVLDDFPVISMATIDNPLPLKLLQKEQSFFYVIDMTQNDSSLGFEMATMKKLHTRFADERQIRFLGINNVRVTFDKLIKENHFEFKSNLAKIMDTIRQKITSHFQIEFIFNIDFSDESPESGTFHVVQLTQLPELKFDRIGMPESISHRYLSITNLQGHGIKRNVTSVVVVSPFLYTEKKHDAVRAQLREINACMRREQKEYMLIVPGRLGSKNKNWGIFVEYKDVDNAVAVFEYGVDIAGRAEPLSDPKDQLGGIYGSHFLYMIQGGHDETQKSLKARKFGTQGTHFLTNLQANNVIYGYIVPGEDEIDPWLFAPPDGKSAVYTLELRRNTTIYADAVNQRCEVVSEEV